MWDTLVIDPMTNVLLWLYSLLGDFILAITFFTILIRVITLPLNLRQQRTMMRTQEIQPQIQAIQKKYKDNPQKMQEEFQKIGYNPAETLTGCLPTLLQFPILIGLYQAIILVLASTPQALFELQERAYSFIRGSLSQLLPVENQFLWLNLGLPDPYFILPVLVVATMFLQQKLLAPTPQPQRGKDGKEQENPAMAMTQSMQYTMPLMFGFFSLQFPAGLSIYFILSNIIGIAQGYYMRWSMNREKAARGSVVPAAVTNGNAPTDKTQAKTQAAAVSQSNNGSRSGGGKQTEASGSSSTSGSGKSSSSKRKRRSAKR